MQCNQTHLINYRCMYATDNDVVINIHGSVIERTIIIPSRAWLLLNWASTEGIHGHMGNGCVSRIISQKKNKSVRIGCK